MRTTRWWGWAQQTSLVALAAALALPISGCDQIKGLTGGDKAASSDDDDSSSKKKKKKKKADEESEAEEDGGDTAEPEATAEASADAAPSAEAAPSADPSASAEPAAGEDEVVRYPGKETPVGGTVKLKIRFKAYQAADQTSKERAQLAPGTFVNLKASFSNWMLVEYPSGVGELSLGWIQLRSATDNTAVDTSAKPPPDAGLTPDASASASASATAPDASTPPPDASAAPTDGGGRKPIPKLRIPPR